MLCRLNNINICACMEQCLRHVFSSSSLERISYLQKNYKNNTRNSHEPFTQISQMLAFYIFFIVSFPTSSPIYTELFESKRISVNDYLPLNTSGCTRIHFKTAFKRGAVRRMYSRRPCPIYLRFIFPLFPQPK